MTNKEKAELIFQSLGDGFEVVAERSTGKLLLRAVAFLQGKCVGFVFGADGKISPYDISNDAIFRTKSEKICESTSAEKMGTNAVAVASIASEIPFA